MNVVQPIRDREKLDQQRLTWESVATPKGEGYTRVYIYRPAPGMQRRAA